MLPGRTLCRARRRSRRSKASAHVRVGPRLLHIAAAARHSDDTKAATQRKRGTKAGVVLLCSGAPGRSGLPRSIRVKRARGLQTRFRNGDRGSRTCCCEGSCRPWCETQPCALREACRKMAHASTRPLAEPRARPATAAIARSALRGLGGRKMVRASCDSKGSGSRLTGRQR